MDANGERLLQAMRAAIHRGSVDWAEEMTPAEWTALFSLADAHHIFPLIFEAVYLCPAFAALPKEQQQLMRRKAIQGVMQQARKTEDFKRLYARLLQAGETPCVVKGILCRDLYPNPDARASGDEDLWVPAEHFAVVRQLFEQQGMQQTDTGAEPDAYEIAYKMPGSPLYIELHQHLFPPESEAYGDLNQLFADTPQHLQMAQAQGAQVYSMPPQQHFVYLVCHAFKHFMHSGFGVRQVCDIALFAQKYTAEMDWNAVLAALQGIRAERFAAAMLKIGQGQLDIPIEGMSAEWKQLLAETDEAPMLQDLLDSGVYGSATGSRLHSSNITLQAVASQKQGKQTSGVMRSLFPPVEAMQGRYPYLKTKPWLLPVAWMTRIAKYGAETATAKNNDAAEAVRTGETRVELLKKYGIID